RPTRAQRKAFPTSSSRHRHPLPSSSQNQTESKRQHARRKEGTMVRKRKELLSSAPWRTGEAEEDDEASRMSREGKVTVTSNPGETPTMNMPRSKRPDLDLAVDDFEEDEIDPELRYSFQRNSRFLRRVFTVDTLVKPLPPVMAYSVSRNVNFFFKIFTQFWGELSQCNTIQHFLLVNKLSTPKK
uniref:Uncharacterized protein n=1 Tax=Aegilops tauschii subsp. strangulata TaxID=200361 RepID=A0A453S2L2_AEGTS